MKKILILIGLIAFGALPFQVFAKSISLNKNGISTILFPVDDDESNWKIDTGSPYHFGDDVYSHDWNSKSGVVFNPNDPQGCNRDLGAPLVAPISGTIMFKGKSTGYGNQIIIRSSTNNSFAVRLAHMDKFSVSGTSVKAGEPIGTLGNSGTTCAHVHLVLYRNLNTSATAISNLKAGKPPLRITGAATTFAAPFTADATLSSGNIIPFLSMLLLDKEKPTPTSTHPLNDTGITFGGNYPSGNNAGCTGETISQQDCSHGRDVTHNDNSDGHAGFSYTKISANGTPLTASAASWSCVKDNVTGLIWEVKTDDNGIHDKDNTYRWGGKTAQGSGYGAYYSDWDTLVDGSNTETLCGSNDWRIPNINELENLATHDRTNPAIDTDYFPYTLGERFWSSSPHAIGSTYAWYVSFTYGSSNYSGNTRDARKSVRLVRGGK